ncbi:MAG: hypothetical protein ABIZ70_14135 [Gemmatimonadales bacterium]
MRTVFRGIVDYAGLFPPASLGMAESILHFEQYRRSPDRAMLGRFVVAASRLAEFGEEFLRLGLVADPADPWRLAAVTGAILPTEMQRVHAFKAVWDARGVIVDAIEHRVANVGQITVIDEDVPATFVRFLEVPSEGPYGPLVKAIGAIGAFAKIRTGGTSPELFPAPEALTQFLIACTVHHVPFKATAGLHHPFRGSFPLTYEPRSDRFVMYGFVNVLLATAELMRGGEGETAQQILEEEEPSAFASSTDAIAWRDTRYSTEELFQVRRELFLGFGSCSFREPVDELRALAVA